ncbi:peptidoglycan D,D-transpeptidase FtsI family protein [Limosilactobacillus fastidiosus]|uniref:Penicillin-binding protein 2 n=1 Tax=Limosilactobacillus fastidiosus TaxID=2759855 RepID=A0A7W3U0N1_9LACO|nr:penicillin-binding protein 2 [Limosilactobacillus fastidiosus]MBB1063715.1 penicillin-binding protein 2 [Limosilactobacillus fastidiosus]MBB1086756.1 penicillin-binding protein 2 [Limosilactobacillus fastidiosus]MCD7084290.1 penicillin-binding protein 2 [Limosilactobacillus fastidiosus]MCD7085517.1 penicillin-binding protein 2 [Limosilactobacillus fastidiosus]MCD7114748.1 penicillin-binding protein 2 [Limosilactobacillus fastidiosus]
MKFFDRITNYFSSNKGKHKNAQSIIPSRLNLLLWIVGILLLMLAGRLFYLQILHGSSYKAEVKRSDTTIQTNNVQRGMIYDSRGQVIVGNQTHQAITYTKSSNVTADQLYKIANRLGRYITVNNSDTRLTDRNEEDYYLANKSNLKQITKKLNLSQDASDDEKYDAALKYLKNHPEEWHLSSHEKSNARIYAAMTGAYSLSTTYIKKSGVTSEELAKVGEHLNQMPGVKIGTAWTRNYPQGKDFQSLTGTVSSSGLPADQINSLLSQGYSRSDNVGQSYLEKMFQGTLVGSKSQTQVTTSGSKVTNEIVKYPGKKGDNLVLTINAKFQKRVQQILEQNYSSAGITYSPGVYAVVMNPHTGAIYAMAGIDRNQKTGKQTPDQIGAINHPITMGSVVKGATIMGGLMSGVITPSDNTLTDQPIKVAGTSTKASWFNKTGSANMALSAPTALEVSSNSYMMQLIMKEGGMNYKPGAQLTLKPSIFDKERQYFNMFGLGQKTGIDLPGETAGYNGPSSQKHIGSALDLSYGNYDGYTVIQLAQYMSTIANGGNRMRPYIVKEIRGSKSNGKLGRVESTTQPQVQFTIPASKEDFDLVRQGLYQVTHGTSSYVTAKSLGSAKPSISGKTGTAETVTNGHQTSTISFAGYSPSKNPQVVVALAIPGVTNENGGANLNMAKQIFSAYWKIVQDSKSTSNN